MHLHALASPVYVFFAVVALNIKNYCLLKGKIDINRSNQMLTIELQELYM